MATKTAQLSIDGLKHEYTEVNHNIRHYSNLRFTIFAVYFAVLSGVVLVSISSNQILPSAPKLVRALGLLITIFFWYYQERASQFYEHFADRGMELERLLGYQQITKRPRPNLRIFYFTTVTRSFFLFLTLFWIYMIFV